MSRLREVYDVQLASGDYYPCIEFQTPIKFGQTCPNDHCPNHEHSLDSPLDGYPEPLGLEDEEVLDEVRL